MRWWVGIPAVLLACAWADANRELAAVFMISAIVAAVAFRRSGSPSSSGPAPAGHGHRSWRLFRVGDQTGATRYHEASHAYLFHKGGYKVGKVKVFDGGGGYTDVHVRAGSFDYGIPPGFIKGVMAGKAAEEEWLVRHHGYSRSAARAEAAIGARSDWELVKQEIHNKGAERRLYEKTLKEVQRNWKGIEMNADRLEGGSMRGVKTPFW